MTLWCSNANTGYTAEQEATLYARSETVLWI